MDGHPGTVPAECRLRCDIRVLPGRERDATFALYERAAESVRSGCAVTVSVRQYKGGGCQSHRIDSTHPLVEAFRLAEEETGQSARTTPFAGGTDARYFAMAGTPAVVYGPGSLEQAHSPNEYVPVAELRLAEQRIRAAALSFLSGSGERP
jgi:acetylornithine deacetylase/succinyl-diaminopimelate desuccinylase-like protein